MPPPLRCCTNAAAAAAPAPLPQQKFTHISHSKIMIFGKEIFVCEMCCFVMTNEKRQKTRNTYYYFYYVRNSRSPLKIIKFSHSLFCYYCSGRAKLLKKRHLTTLHAGQTACRTIYPCAKSPITSKCNTLAGMWAGGAGSGRIFSRQINFQWIVFCVTLLPFVIFCCIVWS
jgi:hypothetical protein